MSLPGISVLVGGMWIMNLSYWGFNQYIIQRALAAKSNREAQKGIIFAAFLKMLMPVLVVLPGIAAVILAPDLSAPDQAYPEVMKLLPVGIKGLVFAALIAAIVSSLASMMNSISTIFTMDIVKHFGGRSEQQLVTVGRIVSLSAMIIATIVARPLLGNFDQAFQYIQEFTGLLHAGHCRDLPAGYLLEENDRKRRACRSHRLGRVLARRQSCSGLVAVYRPRRARLPAVCHRRHAGVDAPGRPRSPRCDRLQRGRYVDDAPGSTGPRSSSF